MATPPQPSQAHAWGLIGGAVVRGEPLPASGPRSLAALGAAAGRNPLAAGCGSGDGGDAGGSGDDGGEGDAAASVVVAAAGWDHRLALDAAGRVLARGWNAHGAADPALRVARVARWRRVAGLEAVRVVQVAAGERHCLALADDGRVFVWGQQCGQTGSGETGGDDGSGHSSGDSGGQPAAAGTNHSTASPRGWGDLECVAGPGTPRPQPVAQIAAGGRHSLAVTRAGEVLAWGSNLQGQCAADRGAAPVDVPQPTRVAALGGVPIRAVAAGAAHSVALSRDGAAYAFGCGTDGALGCGTAEDCKGGRPARSSSSGPMAAGLGACSAVPQLIEGPGLDEEEVVQAACGARHTLLRCASGAVYAFGWNLYGQCCCCWESDGGGGTGISRAWGCAHGEAVYWPLRVRLEPAAGRAPPPQRHRQLEREEEAPAAKAPRLDAGAGSPADSGQPLAAVEVYAGAWHSVIIPRRV
ncbi:hypothetical protein Rsub_11426 [Raphidocelis subcapitata]|uniref:RCC1-like domain-containing protein n=1 Tax=Raphidocelis subcapitata TaxID=307507 RepID=A0A2V0PI32_9CHLO|nr:hypothetical protein Rsub_11426 [Raphidocelis subcapitata]|eukprot:GBF99219.1 hypothetical protein Rsub_11426 [Raphidocelis subcapitata]